MQIKKLILHKYNRYNFNNIETLEYTPQQHLQIILGTNLSGKSSTMKELSPLPADIKKDFKEGGYKKITILHNNKEYNISSGVIAPTKHSFEVDGIEQNVTGLRKIQLELVKEHFNLTPQIFNIILGTHKFTGMSIADRRKWLTAISNIDYTYSLGVYTKIKNNYRDVVGALKIANSKLLQDTDKILDPKFKSKLLKDVEYLNKLIDHILSTKTNVSYNEPNFIAELKSAITAVQQALSTINLNIENPEEKLVAYQYELKIVAHNITADNDKLNKLSKIDINLDLKTLYKEKDKLTHQLKEISSLNKYEINLNLIDTIIASYNEISTDIISLLNNIAEVDIIYSADKVNELNSKINQFNSDKEKIIEHINRLQLEKKKYDDLLDKPSIVCGKCGNEWKLNYDKTTHTEIIKKLASLEEQLDKLNTTIITTKKIYDEYIFKKNSIDNLRNYIKNNMVLKPIFNYVFTKYDLQKDTNSILNEFNTVTIFLDKMKNYTNTKDKIISLENDINIAKASEEVKNELTILNKESISKDLSSNIAKRESLIKQIEDLNNYINKKQKLASLSNKLKNAIKQTYKHRDYAINKMKNEHLNELINLLRYDISQIESVLKDDELAIGRAHTIKNDIDEYQNRERILKIIMKELSPTEGLIAKSINSFLNLFIKDLNTIINSLFINNVKVLAPNIENGDLDYNFPILMNDNGIIDDIAHGSSGLKEVLDLAFRIIFMKYLGLNDYPLYLDEYAVNADTGNRVKAYTAIDSILGPNFSQVFLISHFESMFGRFSNADISILSKENLLVDDGLIYNQHLKLTYN